MILIIQQKTKENNDNPIVECMKDAVIFKKGKNENILLKVVKESYDE